MVAFKLSAAQAMGCKGIHIGNTVMACVWFAHGESNPKSYYHSDSIVIIHNPKEEQGMLFNHTPDSREGGAIR